MRKAVVELQAGIGNVRSKGRGKLRAACGFVSVFRRSLAVRLLGGFRCSIRSNGSGQSQDAGKGWREAGGDAQ